MVGRHWGVGMLAVASLSVAGCTSPSTSARSTKPLDSSPVTATTSTGTGGVSTPPTGPQCMSGTVNVRWQPSEGVTTACVTVGSTVVLAGGDAMSGGTWPGPPTISNGQVLTLASSSATGPIFAANLRAIGTGTATVEVPFVAGPEVCNPTPCTPVPGRPLDWQITVVG